MLSRSRVSGQASYSGFLLSVLVLLPLGTVACSGGSDDSGGGQAAAGASINVGAGQPSSGGNAGTSNTTGGAAGKNAGNGGSGSSTAGGTTACTNGLDDDNDGFIDGFDAECTGALDSDEGTFATGIPGDNRDPKWQDCFFDGNSGAGDDHCRYRTECLYGELPADDPDCVVSQQCVNFCKGLAPNGCDCFGCCTVQLTDGSSANILLDAACSLDNAQDAAACQRCTKQTQCGNDCGECELCAGKTVDDLPDHCSSTPPDPVDPGDPVDPEDPPPPVYTCDTGQAVCGPDLPACDAGRYCSFGCCITSIR